VQTGGESAVTALALRRDRSEALRLAASFSRALESYLTIHGGAAPRTTIVSVVRAWVPRWDADVPPVLADALIEVLVRQGKVVATRHHVGIVSTVMEWQRRFARYPQRLTQPARQVAADCDLPVNAVISLRALAGQLT
jgi:hypothetical protein